MYRTVFLRTSIFCITFIAACTGKKDISPLPFYNTPAFTLQFLTQREAQRQISHTISDFSFTDQNGKPFTNKDVEGKIHVANFIFTTCGSICPVMTKQMGRVQKAFYNDTNVVILSYSVTPWIDSVPRLKDYAVKNNITSANWHLLTGDKNAIYTLARQSYFAEEDLGFTKDSSEFLHTEHVLLIDQSKRIRGIYNGTLQLEIEQLIKDIGELKHTE